MVYEQFLEHIFGQVKEQLPCHCQVEQRKTIKNNGVETDSLFLLGEGIILSPGVDVKACFEAYQKGASMEELVMQAVDTLLEPTPELAFEIASLGNFEKQKDRVIFRLVNYEANQKRLESIPHRRILDLAVIYCLYLQEMEDSSLTAMIHNEYLDMWETTEETLYELAVENTARILPWTVQKLDQLLAEMVAEELDVRLPSRSEIGEDSPMLYVLSNSQGIYGASGILYPSALQRIAADLGQDLYILPSSVHEVLLLPADPQFCCEELEEMVRQVNQSELSPEEKLSDQVYYYSRERNEIGYCSHRTDDDEIFPVTVHSHRSARCFHAFFA